MALLYLKLILKKTKYYLAYNAVNSSETVYCLNNIKDHL